MAERWCCILIMQHSYTVLFFLSIHRDKSKRRAKMRAS
ncbi:unnamed protein product [Spirodela intermedia]|uniref:Uncharacterized protein n=1 Tax=Spirodela intermedia TaxID=51605 RepID=A0A7I8K473_SPIIN|nr:unnamed protein product [Spirodela intermedia]